MKPVLTAAGLAALLVCPLFASAQETGRTYTDADYAQAEKFMSYNVNPLVYHAVRDPQWLPDSRVWYRDSSAKGVTYILVDPIKGTKHVAFDQAKLATALRPFSKHPLDSYHLRIAEFAWPTATRP